MSVNLVYWKRTKVHGSKLVIPAEDGMIVYLFIDINKVTWMELHAVKT